MKFLNKFFLSAAVVAASLSMGSCADDLNQLPTDPKELTDANFKEDPAGYMQQLIADVYLQFATYGANGNASVQGFDGGMSTFQRAAFILEEVPTDEASWIPADADYGLFQYGIIPANNTVVMGTYSRFFINIALCNQFIQTVNAGYFNIEGDATLEAQAAEYIRQAKVLRSAAYWYAIDNFGNVPYLDESVPMGQVGPQLGRTELFNRLTADLEAVVAEYKALDPNQKPAYGYVGLDAAEALLVKYYLNAEVYTGTPQWGKCLEHAQAVIDRLKGTGFQGSGLCNHYKQLFAYSNKQYALGGSNAINEIIWTIPQDFPNLLSYANGTFMLNGWIGTSTPDDTWRLNPRDKYNAGASGWKCITTRKQFVDIFEWQNGYTYSPDQRTALWCTAADGFTVDNGPMDQGHYGKNGFLAVKFSNWAYDEAGNIDYANTPDATDQLGIDCPMIRLAEIYLSAAEAILNGAGDQATALQYVNYVRERAGMPAYDYITLQELQNERARELYTECTRRSDLIRYGKWISGYTWNWKGNVAGGTDFASNFTVYPLPSSVCARNGYEQNPGY